MVANKMKSRATFAIFLFPALALYLMFAIYPLFQGFWLSTTNWDGTAPWVPAQIPIEKFENDIIGKITNPADKDFLLTYYEKSEDQGTYLKSGKLLLGLERSRMMNLLNSLGIVNPDMHGVGLQNYIDVFTGNVDARFFPQTYQAMRFKSGDPMEKAATISRDEFQSNLLPHLSAVDGDFLKSVYKLDGATYQLDQARYGAMEFEQQTILSEIAGLEDDWEALYNDVTALGQTGKSAEVELRLSQIPNVKAGRIPAADLDKIKVVLSQVADFSRLKGLLSTSWYVAETKMGVIVFTGFFVVVNVILVNVLALLLALALDQKLKSRNALRSVFFIPNVLSMIIVAFVWKLIFTQLLPSVTGIHQWMNNPAWAPWITVLVAVWQGVGYYTIIYIAGLQSIPTELMESAAIDGAGGIDRFFNIVLPLLVPAVTICLFLSLSGSLKTFDIIFALYPGSSTPLGIDNITVNIFYDAFRDKHAGLASAKAVLLLFTIVIITGIQLIISKKKEVEL